MKFVKEEAPPQPNFAHQGSTPGLIWPKTMNICRKYEYCILANFHKYPPCSSGVKAKYYFPYIYMHLVQPPPFFKQINHIKIL